MKPTSKNLTRKYVQQGLALAQQIKAAAKPDDLSGISWGPPLGKEKTSFCRLSSDIQKQVLAWVCTQVWAHSNNCSYTKENQTKEVWEGGKGCAYLCGNDGVRKALYLKLNWTNWWLCRVLFCVLFGIKLPRKSLASSGYLVGQVERRAHKGQEGERVFQWSFSGSHDPRAN